MNRRGTVVAVLMFIAARTAARADIIDSTNAGFAIRIAVEVAAPPAVVFRTITTRIGEWWSDDLTVSGSASNLKLEARPAGCLCERLRNGGVQYMVVTQVNAPGLLVLQGGLGPLLGKLAVAGSMSFDVLVDNGSSRVVVSYDVGGYAQGGLSSLAPMVNNVLTQQVQRLKNLIERGTP